MKRPMDYKDGFVTTDPGLYMESVREKTLKEDWNDHVVEQLSKKIITRKITNLVLNPSTIEQDICRYERVLFGEEPSFSEELNLPRKISTPTIRVPEFMGTHGAIQINVEDGFLGTVRRFKVKTTLDTPNAQLCLSDIDSKEIQLVPCCKAKTTDINPDPTTHTVNTVGPDYLPIINEIISILTIRSIIINIWTVTRGWDNIRWFGELVKSAFYGIKCPVDYEMLRFVGNNKRCGIVFGNLKLYELQMDKDGRLMDIERLVPDNMMGMINDEENVIRLLEAYLHLTAKTINCLTFAEKMEFIPSKEK